MITFKEWILHEVNFVPHPSQRDDETIVYLDPIKVDLSWKQGSPNEYIPPGGGGKSSVPGRREDFERFLGKGVPIQAPRGNLWNGYFDFQDGRHRFSVMRDKGFTRVAVTVPKDQSEEIVKRFGG